MTPVRSRRTALWIEAGFALAIVLAFAALMLESFRKGYAVQPFIYNTFDTYMDWFNTAFWAWDPVGAFQNWGTVYPPASFVFLRLLTEQACYIGEPISARDCDWIGRYALYATYAMAVACAARLYWKTDRATAPFRTIAIALGLPLVFALERGNLIIVTLVFTLIGFSPLIGSARLRWLAVAAAINFKVYLIAGLAGFFARRKWLALEASVLLTAVLYAASWTILGAGSPAEVLANIRYFADAAVTHTWQDVYYASTLTSLERLMTETPGMLKFVGSRTVEGIAVAVPLAVRTAQAACVAAILAAFVRPASAPAWRVSAIGIGLAITSSEAGGYTHLLVLALVFLEPWRGGLRIAALVCAYLLSIPNDVMITYITHTSQFSWWANGDVLGDFGVAVGNIVRPILMLLILIFLSLDTLAAFVRLGRAERDEAAAAPER